MIIQPKMLFHLARKDPTRLIHDVLIPGTPWAFDTYRSYCDFLHAVAVRVGVPPRNLFLRGSCKLGYSIAPRTNAWTEMRDDSDLDLAIVDVDYYERMNSEVIGWEQANPTGDPQDREAKRRVERQRDRRFHCCRDVLLPPHICYRHFDALGDVRVIEHCGKKRSLNAFIFRDWYALRSRYELDLRMLVQGVDKQQVMEPPKRPFPAKSRLHRGSLR